MLESMQYGLHSFFLRLTWIANWLATGAAAKPTGNTLSIAHNCFLETTVVATPTAIAATVVIAAAIIIAAAAKAAQDAVSLVAVRNLILEVLNLELLFGRPMLVERINDALGIILTSTKDVAFILLGLEGSSREALSNCEAEVALAIAEFTCLLTSLKLYICTEIGNLALG